ncbi:MAG: hypothetical protein M3220_04135 [Chloroflexota bacterium]|nr:hypothetical protein [Chloroflexota bacterium]
MAKQTKPFRRHPKDEPRLAFVGPCGSGKSTITKRLREQGLDVRMPAQEHSGVPDMWQKLLHPDYLIALDAPNDVLRERRPGVDLTDEVLAEERRRLAHAFAHADLTINTSTLSVEEVVKQVMEWLAEQDKE